MCYSLYMASDRERPEVPWDEAKPAFYVNASDPDAERARGQFTKKKLYYLGSDEGCGCGFQRENDWMSEDPKERDAKRENQLRLASYLSSCLEDEDAIELYGCWSGGEEDEPVRTREIVVADLRDEHFFFIESERIVVKKKGDPVGTDNVGAARRRV
mgnify:CR=1 FL=1